MSKPSYGPLLLHADEGYATDGNEAAALLSATPNAQEAGHPTQHLAPNSSAGDAPAAPKSQPPFARSSPSDLDHSMARGEPPLSRHRYGAPLIGVDIRSLAGATGVNSAAVAAGDALAPPSGPVPAVGFLRPCQTLEICQNARAAGAHRRKSVPEAAVARAALHMLQGLAGEVFVRVAVDAGGGGGDGSESESTVGAGRNNGGSGGLRERFALSSSAASELAVASLSPGALASALGEFVRIGSVAEYLRAFVADAEASTSPAAAAAAAATAAAAAASNRGTSRHPGAARRESGRERKHGHTTQAFTACVRRQLEAFEDVVAQRDRSLYRRQRGLDGDDRLFAQTPPLTPPTPTPPPPPPSNGNPLSGPPRRERAGAAAAAAASGETLLGLLALLRPEAQSLELMMRLVEAGAGWWDQSLRRRGAQPQENAGGLRERTGRLLAALYDSLVTDALVVGPPAKGFGSDASASAGARSPLRCGWVLHVFCEVLAPYLRLVDAWITEGKIVDPHGEIFFSQIGVGGSALGDEGYGGRRTERCVRGVRGRGGEWRAGEAQCFFFRCFFTWSRAQA